VDAADAYRHSAVHPRGELGRSARASVTSSEGPKVCAAECRLCQHGALPGGSLSASFANPICNPFDKARLFVEPGDLQRRLALGVAGSQLGLVFDEQGERLRVGVAVGGGMSWCSYFAAP
jgi:hypothetical protein